MKIKCLTFFLDGKDGFEKDDIRTVDDERGAYFVANGWAEDTAGRVATGTTNEGVTDIAIDNSTLALGDSNA
jgi:hypothetical protein